MRNLKIIFFWIICSIILANNANSMENKILFKVNNEIITSMDIFTELKYLDTINEKFKNTKKQQAFEIAKKSLIREKIKEIQLKKVFKTIKIQDHFLDNLIMNYFKENQFESISDFESYFNLIGINPNIIKKKITIEALWNRLIYKKYNQNVKIDRQAIVNDLKKNNKQKEFLLYEILFNVDKNEKLKEKFNQIIDKINETNFSETAQTYSLSDTANKGGEIGWIKNSSMSKKIRNELQDIIVGDYSEPIVVPGGFLILKIEDTREVDNNFDLNKEIETIIIEKTNNQLNQYSIIFFNKVKKDITINEL